MNDFLNFDSSISCATTNNERNMFELWFENYINFLKKVEFADINMMEFPVLMSVLLFLLFRNVFDSAKKYKFSISLCIANAVKEL